MAGDAALFEHSSHTGTRYLIVTASAPNALSGHLVELLLRRTADPVDTVALFSGLYRGYRSGPWTAPAHGDGLVLLYSADYRYLTGRRFRGGHWLPGTAWLGMQPHSVGSANRSTTSSTGAAGGGGTSNVEAPIPCIDWYSGSTGEYITSTGDCSSGGGGVPGVYTGGGGPGGGGPAGSGGYGGGGGGSLNPANVYLFDGQKPLSEYSDKCSGVDGLWNLGVSNNNAETAGVITADGKFLVVAVVGAMGGAFGGLYHHDTGVGLGTYYYQWPTGQGAPTQTYQGMIQSSA